MKGAAELNPDRPTRQEKRGSGFLRATGGVSILRYWGVSDAFAVLPETRFDPSVVEAADEPMSRERVDEPSPASGRQARASA
jgi:hypothetical protein